MASLLIVVTYMYMDMYISLKNTSDEIHVVYIEPTAPHSIWPNTHTYMYYILYTIHVCT